MNHTAKAAYFTRITYPRYFIQRSLPVLIISGNHDSPERLAFGNRLLESSGIHISPVYNGEITPITLADRHGEVLFWILPFVKPAHVRRYYPDEGIDSYTDAIRVAVEKMDIAKATRNVLLTHQFVTGAATCESEEISVGGTDNVDTSVFADFDYVALGHIHGPKRISTVKWQRDKQRNALWRMCRAHTHQRAIYLLAILQKKHLTESIATYPSHCQLVEDDERVCLHHMTKN